MFKVNVSTLNNISKNLYGRDIQIKQLQDLYQKVENGGFEVVFVSGVSGSGKTILVQKAIKPLIGENTLYMYGKCNQYTHGEPYIPFIESFTMLIHSLLTQPQDMLVEWRKNIVSTLGENCSILMELIPELELVIGHVPKFKINDPQKLKARLELSLKKMFHLIAKKNHTLVMVFDDLQWADLATLKLMEVILEDINNKNLLIIGNYRSEEYENNKHLKQLIDESSYVSISIDQLNFEDTKALLIDFFGYDNSYIKEISNSIYKKTLGNPLYINQIITDCYNKFFIRSDELQVNCLLNYIQQLKVDDDILDLVINRINSLSNELNKLLMIASFLGNKFSVQALAIILDSKLKIVYDMATELTEHGLLLSTLEISEVKDYDDLSSFEFEFVHDRIRQVAYQLVPDKDKKEYHLKIGRALLLNLPNKIIENKVQNIIGHFNEVIDLIKETEEKDRVISLNLLAGKKAKASAAYEAALGYFHSAMALLSKTGWEGDHKVCFDVHFELAECEFLCNNYDASNMIFEMLLKHAINIKQKIDIYSKRTILYSCIGEYRKAMRTGTQALKLVNIYIPKKITLLHMLKEILEALYRLRDSRIPKSIEIESDYSKYIDDALEIFKIFAPTASILDDKLYNLLLLKISNLSNKYGVTRNAAIGYIGYALIAGSILGKYNKAEKFEKLALVITDKYNDESQKCIVYFIIGTFIHQWTNSAQENLKYIEKAYNYALNSGDYLFVGYTITTIIELSLYLGNPLSEIEKICEKHYDFAKSMQFETVINSITMAWKFVNYLQYKNDAGDFFFNNDDFEKKLIRNKRNEIVNYYLDKAQIYYFFGEFEKAHATINEVVKRASSVVGYLFSVDINYYHSLILAGLYNKMTKSKKKRFIRKIKRNQKQLKKWVDYSPSNFRHKYLLVEAELNKCLGLDMLVGQLYDESITLALENGFIIDQAIVNECAGNYYLANGLDKVAKVYLNDSYKAFLKWGAIRKANAMLNKYRCIDVSMNGYSSIMEHKEDVDNLSYDEISVSSQYDSNIIRYFHDIASITDINESLNIFLDSLIEMTKADRGYIMIERKDTLYIEAFKEPWCKKVKLTGHEPIENRKDFPKKVIRYSSRTYKSVVINKNYGVEIFVNDNYIMERELVTLACIPLMVDRIFLGLLYIENTKNEYELTEEMIKTIQMLTTHLSYIKKVHSIMEKEMEIQYDEIKEALSEREVEVLQLIGAGKSNKQIAEELHLTLSTVKTHASNIYSKLNVNRRIQAVMRARELGLIE